MSFEFEAKVLKLTSRRREMIGEGDRVFTKERVKLDVEQYFDIQKLFSPVVRRAATKALTEYSKQLVVERNFYSEFHRSYVDEIQSLVEDLPVDEREKFLARCLPGLQDNDSLRMKVNQEKALSTNKMLEIVSIFNRHNVEELGQEEQLALSDESDHSYVERLIEEVDNHLENQYQLAMLQRKRGVDGQKFLQRFINLFRS